MTMSEIVWAWPGGRTAISGRIDDVSIPIEEL